MNKLIRFLIISLIICTFSGCEQQASNKWVKETPTPTPFGYSEPTSSPLPTVPLPTPIPTPIVEIPLVDSKGIHVFSPMCHQMGGSFLISNVDITNEHLRLINELRASLGLDELIYDETISQIASYRTAEMVTLYYFNHYHPGYTETDENACIFDVAYFYQNGYPQIAENIAKFTVEGGTVSSQYTQEEIANQLFVQFCNSSEHYENMINPDFTKIGLCVFSSGNYALITQIYE